MDQEKLITEIKSLSDSIRTKNRALKLGISERDSFIENTFKPVVGSLKEISNKLNNNILTSSETNTNLVTDFETQSDSEEEESTDGLLDNLEDDVSDTEKERESSLSNLKEVNSMTPSSNLSILANEITSKGTLTRKYLMKMLYSAPKGRNYHVYGARLENDGIMIGDTPLELDDEDNIKIKGRTYPGSHGIFELIFKPNPVKYSAKDLKMFKEILKVTNAHRKHYSLNSPVHRNTSKKYKSVILKLFPPRSSQKTGHGLTMKNMYETNIIYYKNVNKLVDRLQLLWESKQAGHSGLDNEIIALSDELRKRGYIK